MGVTLQLDIGKKIVITQNSNQKKNKRKLRNVPIPPDPNYTRELASNDGIESKHF